MRTITVLNTVSAINNFRAKGREYGVAYRARRAELPLGDRLLAYVPIQIAAMVGGEFEKEHVRVTAELVNDFHLRARLSNLVYAMQKVAKTACADMPEEARKPLLEGVNIAVDHLLAVPDCYAAAKDYSDVFAHSASNLQEIMSQQAPMH